MGEALFRMSSLLLETVTLSYNFLGQRRFGAVDWRPGEIDR